MAILSKRMLSDVARHCRDEHGIRPKFMDLSGKIVAGRDELAKLANLGKRRDYAMQQSISLGSPYIYQVMPGVMSWIIGLEDRRMVHGAGIGGEVIIVPSTGSEAYVDGQLKENIGYLASRGFDEESAEVFLSALPAWSMEQLTEASEFMYRTFYQVSGWKPELMNENRLRNQQQEQINKAIEDQRKHGKAALYAFEKERVLLASIRAGDRNAARRILNEMLSTIYMSSPRFVVLRARSVELMSCLTRAAIEDNPLLEPLIERNHTWTEQLISARNFEDLSRVLMDSLDGFMEGIYVHGLNRSNLKVRYALDYIGLNYMNRVSLQSLADEVGLSRYRLAHLIKQHTGRTVSQIIQEVRIRHAQSLLEKTNKSCIDIAYEVGYSDQSYFTQHFKRVTGTTPVRYRRGRRSG